MPRKAIDYSKTVMYKLVCNDLNIPDTYVGHTTDFPVRKYNHGYRCYNENDLRYNLKVYQTIRANGGWENWQMIEIEKYPCADGNEATTRERYWYEKLNAKLNTNNPNRQYSEWYCENRDKLLEYQKNYKIQNQQKIQERYVKNKEKWSQYCKDNKEHRNEQRRERAKIRVTCQCGSIMSHERQSAHSKTKKHLNFIEQEVNFKKSS